MSNPPTKYGQVIFADTSVHKAEAKFAKVPMYIPKRSHANSCKKVCTESKDAPPGDTLGAFMAVPIVGARFGPTVITKSKVREYCKRVCIDRVLLVIDTGSEAYFVQDDTGCTGDHEVESFLQFCKIGELVKDPSHGIALSVGDMEAQDDTSDFTIEHPLAWFINAPAQIAQGAAPAGGGGRSQMIVVGNYFLQAIAMTFNASEKTILFSHLDAAGNRCSSFQFGPERQKALMELEHGKFSTRPYHVGVRWDTGVSLSGEELTFAGGAGTEPILDTAVDLRFMKAVVNRRDKYGDVVLTVESTNPKDSTQMCLDALVPLDDGSTAHISQPLDTGSETCLIVEQNMVVHEKSNHTCLGGGTVSSVFKAVAGPSAPVKHCESLQEANCQTSCCSTCCLTPSTQPSTKMQCSVPYCTGLLSYTPMFSLLTFPLENGSTNLKDVKTHVGKAQSRCVPAASQRWLSCQGT